MSKIPVLPKRASDSNYPAGAEPWSATNNKVAPDGDYETNGWTPNQPIPAQYENYYHHGVREGLKHARRVTYARISGQGEDTTSTAFARHFTDSRRLVLNVGTGTRRVVSPTLSRSITAAVAPAGVAAAIKGAECRVGVACIGVFKYDAAATLDTIDVFTDATTPARSQIALPAGPGSTAYSHACMDESTGRFVAVSGRSAFAGNAGFASGDLNSPPLVFTPAGVSVAWSIQNNMSVASKPGETRAFSKLLTFATYDGGVTATALANVGFITPLGDPTFSPSGNLFPPTWDPDNNRWVASIARMSISAGDSATHTVLAYSTDGVDWRKLTDAPPNVVFTAVQYHKGWLWAIGRILPDTTGGHGGLEIFFSDDGGVTWHRPGVVLSFHSRGFSTTDEEHYHHGCAIVPCGPHILFQTIVSHTSHTGSGFVSGTSGKAYEAVVVTVDVAA